jgi:succinate-semialdehyde dehydrogenase / glutarate-semialdehyde dehydrogenase
MLAKLRNGGQSCVAANRFLVAEPVAAEFADRLAARMRDVRVGRGTDPATDLGPLINARQRDRVRALVDDALAAGATALLGAAAPGGTGAFHPPTVLVDVPPETRICREEIFGPVAPISVFRDEGQAIAAANDTSFGLVAYAYTGDLGRALRVADALDAGMAGINRGVVSNAAAPFGGVKQSGLGREGGLEGIEEYLETRYVAVDTA